MRRLVSAREDVSRARGRARHRGRPLRPGRRLEAGHGAQRFQHRPGRARTNRRRRAARRVAQGRQPFHTAIAANGKLGATTPIQSGWATMTDPALVAVPGGLRAFWGGIRTTDPTETQTDLSTAFSADGVQLAAADRLGRPARRPGLRLRPGRHHAAERDHAAVVGGHARQLDAQRASTPRRRTSTTRRAGGYGNDNNLATNASGATMLAWFSDTPPGIRAQAVGADGAPAGAPMTMPGTQVMVGGPELSRTPIVARPKNGGFYIARGRRLPDRQPGAGVARRRVLRGAAGQDRRQRRDRDLDRRQGPPVGRVVGRHVRRQARLVSRSSEDAVRFGEPVDVGAVKDGALGVLARRQRDRVGRRRRAGRVRRRHRHGHRDLRHARAAGPDAGRQEARATASPSPSPTRASRSRARRSRPAGSPARRTPRARSS